MAVFTPVSEQELNQFLTHYNVGTLLAFSGIDSGIENTNYFVTTSGGEFVLTLFERLHADQLPFYLNLMHHLAQANIKCPDPVASIRGERLLSLCGKPASLVTKLAGGAQMAPGVAHCREVGGLLAKMHLAAADYPERQANLRGIDWWRTTVPKLLPKIPSQAQNLLEDEMATQSTFANSAGYLRLPRSAVHADLFCDNVLFAEENGEPKVGGVIDFYFAGYDTWVYDLAVATNDWCTHSQNGHFDSDRLAAFLSAYQQTRPLTQDEKLAWPYALRAAALRFWISRLDDTHAPRQAQLVLPKDPGHFERILQARRQDAVTVGQSLLAG